MLTTMLDAEKIRKIIKLRKEGGTIKWIARTLEISKNTAKKYIRLLETEGDDAIVQIIETSKNLPKRYTSRHLHSYRKATKKGSSGGKKMASGQRAKLALSEYRKMYRSSSKMEKGHILDEFCKITKYHRKHAITVLGKDDTPLNIVKARKPLYSNEALFVIERIWEESDYPWSERLVVIIPLWLTWAKKHMTWITPEVEQEIRKISARQIDRRLKDKKKKLKRKMYGRTKPGTLLKHHIPIKTDNWDVTEPGYTEVDLVSHSGSNASGTFIYSLSMTDILTGWVETVPIMGKTDIATLQGIEEAIKGLPFPIKGIDTDNGTEFINDTLYRYCESHTIQFTRGRPYKKNDNAHIEQKNWTHVRKIMGYKRFDSYQHFTGILNLYRNKLRLMMNLFQPCVKLKKKERVGSKITRKYEPPATPLDRVVTYYKQHNLPLSLPIKRLLQTRESTDPFKLSKEISKVVKDIQSMKNKTAKQVV